MSYKQGRQQSHAFTIIELMIVIAIIMVLMGILVPTMGKVRAGAKATSRLAGVKQSTVLILAYISDYRDTFPILYPGGNPLAETREFYKALINSGAISNKQELDPVGWKEMKARGFDEIDLVYSMCLVYDPEFMVRGLTLPGDERKSRPVRMAEVAMPDKKGAMWVTQVFDGSRVGGWCCVPGSPKGPVGFIDGSAGDYFALELLPDQTLYLENEIGSPVHTTWGGAKGRDR